MLQRRFRPISFAIAIPASLGVLLGSCTSQESVAPSSDSALSEAQDAIEAKTSRQPPETHRAPTEAADATNVETPAQTTASDASQGSAPASSPSPLADDSSSPSTNSEPQSPQRESPEPEPQTAEATAKEPDKVAVAEIRIDETVCGTGGQEAYFETKAQEIYICKNAENALTYIATPKRKGNSFFLPAQKIQQGDVVGYAAMDDTKTYIVTPGGFQLQDNGKPQKSEKVIRRQLSE